MPVTVLRRLRPRPVVVALLVVALVAGVAQLAGVAPAGADPVQCHWTSPALSGVSGDPEFEVTLPADTDFKIHTVGSAAGGNDSVVTATVHDASGYSFGDSFIAPGDGYAAGSVYHFEHWSSTKRTPSSALAFQVSISFIYTIDPVVTVDVVAELAAEDCDRVDGSVNGARNGSVASNGEAGDPVTTGTGNFFYQPDVADVGTVGLSYNSLDQWRLRATPASKLGLFGTGWASLLDTAVAPAGNGSGAPLMFRSPTGRTLELASPSSNTWTPPSELHVASVTRDSTSGVYTWAYETGEVWTFDPLGRLESMADPRGGRVDITRSAGGVPTRLQTSVDSTAFQAWDFLDTGTTGLIDRITGPYAASASSAPAGTTVVDLGYTGDRLETVSAPYLSGQTPAATLETYSYRPNGLIGTITRAQGGTLSPVTVLTNTYDDALRVKTQTSSTGEVDEFDYQRTATQLTTTVDHENGAAVERVVYFHDPTGRLTRVEDPYTKGSDRTWQGDQATSSVTRRGGETTAAYDTGRPTSIGLADPDDAGEQSATVSVTYCGAGDDRPVDVTDAAGTVTRYWWTTGTNAYACDAGRPVPVKITRGYGTSAAWDTTYAVETAAPSLVKTVTVAPGTTDEMVTTYNWDLAKRVVLSKVDYPDGTAQPGRFTYYGYDDAGRLKVERDPTGAETWWVHDAAGRVTSQIGPFDWTRSCTTSCAFGATAPVSSPSSSSLWRLDGTLASTTDAMGQTTTYSTVYDGSSRVETVTAPTHESSSGVDTKTVTVSTYDRFDRLVSVVTGDPAVPASLSTTTYTNDKLGRVKKISQQVDGTGTAVETSFGYDDDGNQTVTAYGADPTDTDRQSAKKVFDLRGRLIEEWGPTGDTSPPSSVTGSGAAAVREHRTWTYDEADRVTETTTGDGAALQRTSTRYDALGRVRYEITDRDGDGVPLDATTGAPTDPDDAVTEYAYTADGRLEQLIEPPTDVTSYDWIGGDQSKKRTTSYGYDGAGQNTTVTNPLNKTTSKTYTARGQLLRTTKPGGSWTEYGYDPAGRTTSVTNPSPTGTGTVTTLTTYRADGQVSAKTDQHTTGTSSPPTTTYDYYPDGLLKSSTNPLGGTNATVRSFYDARGNRTSRVSKTQATVGAAVTDVTDTWTYDRADRVTAAKRPGESTGTTYGYDPITGWQTTKTQPTGRVDTTAYWNNGQVRSVTSTKPAEGSSPAATYRVCTWHDSAANTTATLEDDTANASACTGGDVTTQQWDHTGQLTQVAYPDTPNTPSAQDETYNYTWDLQGRPRTFQYPDGTKHRFTHDRAGRFSQSAVVWSGGGGWPIVGYTYDDNDNRLKETVNWTEGSRTFTYPSNGSPKPTSYVQQIPGGNRTTALAWRPDGRLGSEATGTSTRTYTYDTAGQLTGRADSTGPDHTYTYGPRGLRLSSAVDTTTTTNTFNDKAQLVSAVTGTDTDTTSYGYDADGRRTSTTGPTSTQTVTYDPRGLLNTQTTDNATGDDITEQRTYDADRRLTTTTLQIGTATPTAWSYTWDPTRPAANPLEIRVNNSLWIRSNYGLEMVGVHYSTSGTANFYAFDHRRSVLPSDANTGAPTDYDPYGTPTSFQGVQHAYRSEVMQLDLIHLRNRDYQPSTGQFTTPDPLDGTTGTTTETNPYHYADNDPTNKTDPLGLSPTDCDTANANDPFYQGIYGQHPGVSCDDLWRPLLADGIGCFGDTISFGAVSEFAGDHFRKDNLWCAAGTFWGFGATIAIGGGLVNERPVRVSTGPSLAPSLPSELTVGRNAELGVDVYQGVSGGKPVYVGITNSLERRAIEHAGRFTLTPVTPSPVTRGEARAIEEALIARHPDYLNLRHEISPSHPWYDAARLWGEHWLKGNGFL